MMYCVRYPLFAIKACFVISGVKPCSSHRNDSAMVRDEFGADGPHYVFMVWDLITERYPIDPESLAKHI